jgi:hypothetical protein
VGRTNDHLGRDSSGGMIMVGRLGVVIWTIIVVWATVGGIACAQTASALVLETRGVNLPHLSPYSEVLSGTTVVLPQGAKLVFLHYPSCRTVAVIGGKITFAEDTYTVTGGTTEAEVRSQCPRIVRMSAEYQTGGTLLRGHQASTLTLSPNPTFVLVGKRAGDFASVRVSQGGREVLAAPLDGRQFRWPSRLPPLSADHQYELALVPRSAGADPVTKRFKVEAPTTQFPSAVLTLLKVE